MYCISSVSLNKSCIVSFQWWCILQTIKCSAVNFEPERLLKDFWVLTTFPFFSRTKTLPCPSCSFRLPHIDHERLQVAFITRSIRLGLDPSSAGCTTLGAYKQAQRITPWTKGPLWLNELDYSRPDYHRSYSYRKPALQSYKCYKYLSSVPYIYLNM